MRQVIYVELEPPADVKWQFNHWHHLSSASSCGYASVLVDLMNPGRVGPLMWTSVVQCIKKHVRIWLGDRFQLSSV